MEGDGDLMKMLMHADPADENIQGAMEDTSMVQSGGFPQTGMGFGSTHYGGMQQQMPTISPQRQQQQRGSGYPPMNPSQMIPRSPNNGMMQPDMDVVLQQQQQYQQQAQQSAYGNGSYQGYNGGYQGSSSVPPQNHSQTMNPYQAGYPSESGYPPGTSGSQAMGDFGPQTGLNQAMGMPGPASLSLAAMSNRQQYYGDSYGMNQPVSPVHKQMPQGGGFLQPSGMPYSQQVPSYPSSSYPKRPPSSPVQTQMQGFSSGGSSYTPRSSAGMQMPNMPYQTSTNPYQPPRSPSRRSSSTSPVPQQDTGMYSRPHEPFSQPRSPFGPNQGHFQQQQPQQHSSCMFVQPNTTPQAHYQSQQLMGGTKAGGVTQRRASYPGQQNTVQMPSSPLKRSPPSKTPSPNPKSPDFTRAGQPGFEERSSIKKPVAKKVKASPPSSDPSPGLTEATGTVSNSVQCSFKQKAVTSQKVAEGKKGVPHQKRSASNAERQSVSPPTGIKEGMDEKAERKSKESNGSNGVAKTDVLSRSPKIQEGDQGETRSSNSKVNESSGNVEEERKPNEANKIKTEKGVGEQTISKSPQSIGNHDKEDREEGEAIVAKSGETDSNARVPIRSDEVLSSKAKGMVNKTLSEGKDVSSSKNVLGEEDELISKIEHKSGNGESEHTNPMKNVKDEDKSSKIGALISETSGGAGKAVDKTSEVDRETGEISDTSAKSDTTSEQNVSVTRKTNQPIDETVDKSIDPGRATGQLGKTGADANPGTSGTADASNNNKSTVGEDGKSEFDDKANKMQTLAKEAEDKELVSKGNPSSDEDKAESKTDSSEATSKVPKEVVSQSTDGKQAAKPQEKKDKPKVPSLRCNERLSSDDDDHKTDNAKAESESAPVVENRTLGIQTIQQNTATARATQQQAAPIKATIIAKGKSSQTNQQVMVAKTTTGQMYLIQGNILVPVQTVSTKDDPSKQNPQLIIVNPAKTASGQQGGTKQPVAAAKGVDRTETSKGKKDEKGKARNSPGSLHNKASKVAVEPKAANESSSSSKKSDEIVQKSERSPNTKTAVKSDKSPTAKGSKRSPTQPEKGSNTAEKGSNTAVKEKQTNKTETPRLKHSPDSKSPDKREEKHSPSEASSKQTSEEESTPKLTRGRPLGSKDKQKRKSYVHKVKRKQDDVELEEMNSQELALTKPKFSKTAVAVQQMSSSTESSTKSKRPLEVPTVSATKSPKRRKVSTSSSPVKHISTRPRGGIDGDSWVCSLCGKRSGSNLLGDLYGPYKTKFSKEKTDSSSKEGKQSQKLSSPSRKSSSSSDVQVESESCDVELWIHRDCGVWSPGVFMLGRTIHGLEQAVESAAQHKCTMCSEVGATLACFKRGCIKMFHYACGRDSGCSFIEDNFTIFCSTHK